MKPPVNARTPTRESEFGWHKVSSRLQDLPGELQNIDDVGTLQVPLPHVALQFVGQGAKRSHFI